MNPDAGAELRKQENSLCKEGAHRAARTSHMPFMIRPLMTNALFFKKNQF